MNRIFHRNKSRKHLKEKARFDVIFAGYHIGKALLDYYRRAKVYCQLSAHKGFSVALAETMEYSCVPIISKRCAFSEVVEDTGFYASYNNPRGKT